MSKVLKPGATILKIIPVLDVRQGQAVHARAGLRDHYRPLQSYMHENSEPLGLALAFRDKLGLFEIYLADLDALAGEAPALELYQAIQDEGLRLWVDAGIRDTGTLPILLEAGVATIIAGSETLAGSAALARVVSEVGADRLVFSLDLRLGHPWTAEGSQWPSGDPLGLVEAAWESGVRRLLVLDVGRVGTGEGPGTLPLLAEIRAAWPDLRLTAGGGVSGPDDLARLAQSGASAVLVGSALYDGRIGPGDVKIISENQDCRGQKPKETGNPGIF